MKHKFKSINNFASMYRYKAVPYDKEKDYVFKPKLHGTNASIRMDKKDLFECRSKNRVLSVNDDHMDFTKTMNMIRDQWTEYLKQYNFKEVLIMGEWAGPGVQKSDAVSLIGNRTFFPFAVMVDDSTVYSTSLGINAFFTQELRVVELPVIYRNTLNFNEVEPVQDFVDDINAIVEQYEEVDPFIYSNYGIKGCGEGIVGTLAESESPTQFFEYAFKAKTEAHRVKKTKSPAAVREPIPQEALQFASTYVTKARMEQCISELGIKNPLMQDTQEVLRWMNADILKESTDDVKDMGVDYSKLVKPTNTRIVTMWKAFVNGDQDGLT